MAREWRFKWSADDDKASLAAARKLLTEHLATVKAVKGVKSVQVRAPLRLLRLPLRLSAPLSSDLRLMRCQRVVCGGCLDFKVVTALDAESFGEWEGAGFAPEAAFLEAAKAIPGVTTVETQTYTLMPC